MTWEYESQQTLLSPSQKLPFLSPKPLLYSLQLLSNDTASDTLRWMDFQHQLLRTATWKASAVEEALSCQLLYQLLPDLVEWSWRCCCGRILWCPCDKGSAHCWASKRPPSNSTAADCVSLEEVSRHQCIGLRNEGGFWRRRLMRAVPPSRWFWKKNASEEWRRCWEVRRQRERSRTRRGEEGTCGRAMCLELK